MKSTLAMQWELARHLVAAGALRCTHDSAHVALVGLASGSWGLALALDEFVAGQGNDGFDEHGLKAAADRYAVSQVKRGEGLGLFTGYEGQLLLNTNTRHVSIHVSHGGTHREEPPGDLMNGSPGVAWAQFCLGEPCSRLLADSVADTKPGLAHGHLVRYALPGQLAYRDCARPLRAEIERLGGAPGWCNGIAGAIVATTSQDLVECYPGASGYLIDLVTDLTSFDFDTVVEMGLCHGLLGIAVVLAGTGRLYGWPHCTNFANLVAEHAFERLDDGLERVDARTTDFWETDLTWLTGAAGILWALQVVKRQPEVNPLFPLDSVRTGGGLITSCG